MRFIRSIIKRLQTGSGIHAASDAARSVSKTDGSFESVIAGNVCDWLCTSNA